MRLPETISRGKEKMYMYIKKIFFYTYEFNKVLEYKGVEFYFCYL